APGCVLWCGRCRLAERLVGVVLTQARARGGQCALDESFCFGAAGRRQEPFERRPAELFVAHLVLEDAIERGTCVRLRAWLAQAREEAHRHRLAQAEVLAPTPPRAGQSSPAADGGRR